MSSSRRFILVYIVRSVFHKKQYEIDSKEKLFIIAPMVKCCRVICTRNWFGDTFRALYPLLNLVYPSINKEMQKA
jgi:putative alpha-1,2-mannosidase